jgi:hypothetical protein
MVISPLLRWYVEQGLKVTQIHQVAEYTPATCFQKFGEQVSEARRARDDDPELKIVAEIRKLPAMGKQSLTKRDTHTSLAVKSIKSAAISSTLPSVAVTS